jgi:hypothetical protein
MQTDSLHVNRLSALYQLPKSQARASGSVKRRFDSIARNLLIRNLENQFTALSDSAGMYFIERLELDLTLNIDDSDEALAAVWARALHESIQRTILNGNDGLIAFPGREAYLAGLIEHLLRGSTGDCWYFKELSSLESLTSGQAISELLREDPDAGRDAMIELTRRGDLDLFLVTVSDAELADIVGECLLPASPTFIAPASYPRWTRALHTLLNSGTVSLTSVAPRDVARLYLSLLRVEPGLGPDVNLARFIRDLLQLGRSILAVPDRATFLRLVESEEIASSLVKLGDGGPLLVNLIRNSGGVETAALLRDLETTNSYTSQIATDFGGIFLLAQAILELEVTPLLNQCVYPNPSRGSKAGLLLFLIALQCLAPNAKEARRDRALATFAGLPDVPSAQLLREYCETLKPAMHRKFEEMLRPIVRKSQQLQAGAKSSSEAWFTLCSGDEPILVEPQFDSALSGLSNAILQNFASKLGAFSDSSPPFLLRNFLASRAMVEVSDEDILVRFLTCPLQMVLRMAGFDQHRLLIPWAGDRNLEVRFE